MAVGDVVGEIYSTTTSFQPASGVEIALTAFFANDSESKISGEGDYDTAGNNIQYGNQGGTGSNRMIYWHNSRQGIFLTNTKYMEFYVNASYSGFSGIQIK